MPILPNGQMLPYYNTGGQSGPQSFSQFGQPGMQQLMQGAQMPRFSQQQGASPAPGTVPPQQGQQQVDPRLQMWIQQQMQRRQAGNMPRFTQPMTVQDRMGMIGPGIAGLKAGVLQGPARQGVAPGGQGLAGMQQGMSTGMSPQNLQGVQTGSQDLVAKRRRGVLGGAI